MKTLNILLKENTACKAADGIGLFNSAGVMVASTTNLSGLARGTGTLLGSWGLLADTHNMTEQSTESSADLQRALEYFNTNSAVSLTCNCADITENNTESGYQRYFDNIALKSPNTPVYSVAGNHDTSNGFNKAFFDRFILAGKTGITIISSQLYYMYNTAMKSYFVFLSMNNYSLGDSGKPYDDKVLEDLVKLLDSFKSSMTYQSPRVFIITHLFDPDRAGNFKSIYPRQNWLGGTQLARLRAISDTYVNAIWFSGHSHWKWHLQKYQPTANICKHPTNGSYFVHVPSCAVPIDSDGVSTRESKPLESEGGVVECYDDFINIKGMDLKLLKDIPIANYKIPVPSVANANMVTIRFQDATFEYLIDPDKNAIAKKFPNPPGNFTATLIPHFSGATSVPTLIATVSDNTIATVTLGNAGNLNVSVLKPGEVDIKVTMPGVERIYHLDVDTPSGTTTTTTTTIPSITKTTWKIDGIPYVKPYTLTLSTGSVKRFGCSVFVETTDGKTATDPPVVMPQPISSPITIRKIEGNSGSFEITNVSISTNIVHVSDILNWSNVISPTFAKNPYAPGYSALPNIEVSVTGKGNPILNVATKVPVLVGGTAESLITSSKDGVFSPYTVVSENTLIATVKSTSNDRFVINGLQEGTSVLTVTSGTLVKTLPAIVSSAVAPKVAVLPNNVLEVEAPAGNYSLKYTKANVPLTNTDEIGTIVI